MTSTWVKTTLRRTMQLTLATKLMETFMVLSRSTKRQDTTIVDARPLTACMEETHTDRSGCSATTISRIARLEVASIFTS